MPEFNELLQAQVRRSLLGPLQQRHIGIERVNASGKCFARGQPQRKRRRVGQQIDHLYPPGVHREVHDLIDGKVIIQPGSPPEKPGDSLFIGVDRCGKIRHKRPLTAAAKNQISFADFRRDARSSRECL